MRRARKTAISLAFDTQSARADAIPYPNVLATTYHALGIDPHAMVTDVSNRPNPVLPGAAQVIDRLV